MTSLYQGKKKFDRPQLVFMVEAILIGALDRIESGLPDQCAWDDRVAILGEKKAKSMCSYEYGALEAAGMSLAVLYAQLTDDGLGIGDALAIANHFDDKVEEFVALVWKDKGKKVKKRQKQLRGDSYNPDKEIYDFLFPGKRPLEKESAEAFVETCFQEYLAAKR